MKVPFIDLGIVSEEELDALAEQGAQALTPPEPVQRCLMAPPRDDDEPDYEVEVME